MSKNQDYDKIIRESVERVIPTIIEKLCGLHPEKVTKFNPGYSIHFRQPSQVRPQYQKSAQVLHTVGNPV